MATGGICAIIVMMHSRGLCIHMTVQFAGVPVTCLQSVDAVYGCVKADIGYSGSLHLQVALQYADALCAFWVHVFKSIYKFLF